MLTQSILQRKAGARVLILGPYRPQSAKRVIAELRDCLRKNGYELASLVEDLSYRAVMPGERPELYFLEKSKYMISNWAQSLMYVFPSRAEYSGVIIEFEYMLHEVNWLIDTSTVFFEKRDFGSISLMLKGRVRTSGINQRFFSTKVTLCNAALAELLSHLRARY